MKKKIEIRKPTKKRNVIRPDDESGTINSKSKKLMNSDSDKCQTAKKELLALKKELTKVKAALRKRVSECEKHQKIFATLQTNEERFRRLLNLTRIGFHILDSHGRVIDANDEYVRITGHRKLSEILGKRVTDWTSPMEMEKNALALQECLRVGHTQNLRIDYIDHQKKIIPVEINAFIEGKGKSKHIIALCRDVSDHRTAEETMRENKGWFQAFTAKSALSMLLAPDGTCISCSQAILSLHPECAQMVGKVPHEYARERQPDGRLSSEVARENLEIALTHGSADFEWENLLPDGTTFMVLTHLSRLDMGGQTLLFSASRDITELKKAEAQRESAIKALRESEEKYRALVELSPLFIDRFLPDGTLTFVNGTLCRWMNCLPQDLIGKNILLMISPEEAARSRLSFNLISPQNPVVEFLGEVRNPAGEARHIRWLNCGFFDQKGTLYEVQSFGEDFSERRMAEEKIEKALREKEILLRELYHRTKNNMQVICSLLNLQATHTSNNEVKEAFHEMSNRIIAMALVHKKLYQGQDLSQVSLDEYFEELARLLLKSYHVHAGRVALQLDLEPVEVLIDAAIPLGLVLNEFVSNSLKYAFPRKARGIIRVHLARIDEHCLEIRLSDNGIGVPESFDFRKQQSWGLKSIFGLVEKQLQGKVAFAGNPGFSCHIPFSNGQFTRRV